MTVILFIIDLPSPQRTPLLDSLTRDEGIDLLVIYREARDETRGWGGSDPKHPYIVLSGGSIRRVYSVLRHVWRRDIGVVCLFGYRSAERVAAAIASRVLTKRLVMRSDNNVIDELSRPPWRRLLKKSYLRVLLGKRMIIWTIGQRNDQYWSLLGFRERRLVPYRLLAPPIGTIEDGERLRSNLELGKRFIILYVGCTSERKGISDLVHAIDGFRGRCSDKEFVLVVVGCGPLDAWLERGWGRCDWIRLVGSVPNDRLGPYYAAADMVAVPSRAEGWSWVVNEAVANGLYVVASDRVGAADDLVDEANGRRYTAGSVEELEEIIRATIDRPIPRGVIDPPTLRGGTREMKSAIDALL